ncbi:hypothetical protein CPB97_005525 [Podila verticillata]|nr:hypothetical protein CPB97_005525 [Podila verticillata]
MTERLHNTSIQIIGGAKQAVGSALGFPEIAASGATQKAQAENAQRMADDQTRTEGVGHKIEGEVQQKVGELTGDKSMEARGHANESIGDIKRNV